MLPLPASNKLANKTIDLGLIASIVAAINWLPAAHINGFSDSQPENSSFCEESCMHPTTVRKWSLIVLAFGCTTLLVGGVWASSRILLQGLKISHQISPYVTNRTTALRVVGLESVGSRIKI